MRGSKEKMASKDTIIFCNCSWYDVVPEEVRTTVLQAITDAGVNFCSVSDLCGLAAQKDERLAEWANADGLKVVGCFSRTIKWLFHFAGFPLKSEPVVLNMRKLSADTIIEAVLGDADTCTSMPPVSVEKQGDWTPWFPVIDRDRCINCKQCLNFCLFGVYQLSDDGNVEVAKPANCKTNCPACARVCPEAAIIFPKYGQSPINGDEVNEETLKAKNADLNTMLDGEDIHSLLRRRGEKKKRFSADKPQPVNIMDKLDIPSQVLADLSAGDIAAISKRAKGSDCPNRKFCDDDCEKDHEDKNL